MKYIGIIPARYGSSRFPGKPLALIGNKPMIELVYEQARKGLSTVVVATDDRRIYDCVIGFGGEAVMTRSDHTCGTERCLEAWNHLSASAHYEPTETVIVNIQGDEPFIDPEEIKTVCQCFENGAKTELATLVQPFAATDSIEVLTNPNTPKVAIAFDRGSEEQGRALLFSRSVIPYIRGVQQEEWLQKGRFYRHIGLYAYRADVLPLITALPPSTLEKEESLEQLRWLENGYEIRVAVSHAQRTFGIDTPDDLKRANDYWKNMPK